MAMLRELTHAGVSAFKIEGRQRGRAYVTTVVQAFRTSLDALLAGRPFLDMTLDDITEGRRDTTGAYERKWR